MRSIACGLPTPAKADVTSDGSGELVRIVSEHRGGVLGAAMKMEFAVR
jgi:hypothetical protein